MSLQRLPTCHWRSDHLCVRLSELIRLIFIRISDRTNRKGFAREMDSSSKDLPSSRVQRRNDTFLEFYASSSSCTRSFCARCGTTLTYCVAPMPKPWPLCLYIWLGTIDREDLEKDWLNPQAHCWIDVEVPWIGKLACEGSGGIPRYVGGSDFNNLG